VYGYIDYDDPTSPLVENQSSELTKKKKKVSRVVPVKISSLYATTLLREIFTGLPLSVAIISHPFYCRKKIDS